MIMAHITYGINDGPGANAHSCIQDCGFHCFYPIEKFYLIYPVPACRKIKKNEQPRVEISSYVIVTLKWRDHVMSHLIVLRNFVEMGGAYLKYYNALTFDFASES